VSGKVSYGPLDYDFKEKSITYKVDPSKQLFLHPAEPSSYIIFQEDGLVKARNGLTGKIEFSSTDASTAMQQTFNALPNGGKVFIRKGVYDLKGNTIQATNVSELEIDSEKAKLYNGVLKFYGSSYDANKHNLVRRLVFENAKIRIENGFNNTVEHCEFYGGDVQVELANTREWSEANRFINCRFYNPSVAGIAFRTPVSPETNSYIHTRMDDCFFDLYTAGSSAIRVENGTTIGDSVLVNARFWAHVDSANVIYLDGDAYKTLFINPKFESFQTSPTALYAIYVTANAGWIPALINTCLYGTWTSFIYNPNGKWMSGDVAGKNSASIPVGVNGAYGDRTNVIDCSSYLAALRTPKVKVEWGGTFGSGETVTVKVIFHFIDDGEAYVEKSATAVGGVWLSDDDYFNLYPSFRAITAILAQAKTNLSSTSVTVTVKVYG